MESEDPLAPGLYVTATPIGNLGDITYRAIDALKRADAILCEDTRRTAKLCAHYAISTPRKPYHDHNAERARPAILNALEDGARYCLVSDAGTPLIADPGYKLVHEARARGIAVYPLPGPASPIAALSAAGLPTDRFTFVGFPPPKSQARTAFFTELGAGHGTIVFFETAQRLPACLADLAALYPDRTAVVARELTKRFETFVTGSLKDLSENDTEPFRGECVVMLAPKNETAANPDDLDAFLQEVLAGGARVKDAAAAAADAFSIPKKEAYARALTLKNADA